MPPTFSLAPVLAFLVPWLEHSKRNAFLSEGNSCVIVSQRFVFFSLPFKRSSLEAANWIAVLSAHSLFKNGLWNGTAS